MKRLAERLSGVPPARPKLRIVGSDEPPPPDEAIIRDCRHSRIKWLAKAYDLQWLVDQHCVGNRPDMLSFAALEALHRDMERARECVAEGIAFDDAGLVKHMGAL